MPFRDRVKQLVQSRQSSSPSSASGSPSRAPQNREPDDPTSEVQKLPIIGKGPNYGVKVLYDGNDETQVDIVFVHGLTGNAYTTWRHENGIHWPSELLKQDLPGPRVLSFGYDADIVKMLAPAGNSRLTNHAANLVGSLVREREESSREKSKIIFVAHSLGGLVVEAALSHSKHNDQEHLKQMELSTRGIIFLGVPHAGADLAGLATLVARMANTVKSTNRDILKVLEPNSEMLNHVENQFQMILKHRQDIPITCFYEELRVNGVGEVVPQRSAKISGQALYPIHANHMVLHSPRRPWLLADEDRK